MPNEYPNLFKPLRIKNKLVRNRIMQSPHMISMVTTGGAPSEYMIRYFEEKARGGAAIVTIGDTPVDLEYAPGNNKYLKITRDNLALLSELASAIRENGALASLELNHAGGLAAEGIIGAKKAIGPSSIPEMGIEVTEMDMDLMRRTADCYADCAEILKIAGFDMCMLHGAFAWLLAQFISPKTNRRKDDFGGSIENRARFPLMVVDEVRKRCGENFLIEYKLSLEEYAPDGLKTEDGIAFGKMLEGRVDLITTGSGGMFDPPHADMVCSLTEHGSKVFLGEELKKHISTPIAVQGSISDPEMAEAIIAGGRADFVSAARALIADPEFPKKAKEGRSRQIRPCLRCNSCLSTLQITEYFRCVVNPRAGREFRVPEITAAEKPKKAAVIGGGIAGMQAALTAAQRGHDVTLYEKNAELGGIMRFTDKDDIKTDIRRFKDYLADSVKQAGVKIHTGCETSPGQVKACGCDAVIVAVGSEPVVPRIPGIDGGNVYPVLDIYDNMDSIGKNVVIIGGGLAGCETSLHLAKSGRSVTIVEMLDDIAGEANFLHKPTLEYMMSSLGVTVRTGSACKEITRKGVIVSSGAGEDIINADTVVYAVGMRARQALADSFLDAAPEVLLAGDCLNSAQLYEAVHGGYRAAMQL